MKSKTSGAVLFETLWMAALLGGLVLGTHLATVKYWNHRLKTLEKLRLRYDGRDQWKP
jgi:hypothetical protein